LAVFGQKTKEALAAVHRAMSDFPGPDSQLGLVAYGPVWDRHRPGQTLSARQILLD
jgi:hypothetical protein